MSLKSGYAAWKPFWVCSADLNAAGGLRGFAMVIGSMITSRMAVVVSSLEIAYNNMNLQEGFRGVWVLVNLRTHEQASSSSVWSLLEQLDLAALYCCGVLLESSHLQYRGVLETLVLNNT